MLKLPGTLIDKGQMADGTRRIMVYTQEVTPEQLFEVLKHAGKFGWFVFSDTGIKESDLPTEPIPEFSKQKSLSERLRNTIFRLWEKKGSKGDFEDYRRKYMERLIDLTKQKIDEA